MRRIGMPRTAATLTCGMVALLAVFVPPLSVHAATDAPEPPEEFAPGEFRLRIDRGFYNWECEQYIVEFVGDGSLECLCKEIGAEPGEYVSQDSFRITWDDVKPLIETVYSDEFMNLGDSYEGRTYARLSEEGDVVVGELRVRPNPAKRTVVAVWAGEFFKNVTAGASGAPLIIEKLVREADEVVERARGDVALESPGVED